VHFVGLFFSSTRRIITARIRGRPWSFCWDTESYP